VRYPFCYPEFGSIPFFSLLLLILVEFNTCALLTIMSEISFS